MRYYVVINGESSLNIQGLAIQSLPNISKPLMRSRREEIDGRDGDIITKLGYSAYDKTLKIGLWGNYDINQVIAFFNQEGVITFSNEPDKYYNFTILNREDYINQLEAFREASITIHCQPYKYELNEQPVELENEYVEQEGTSLTFNNSLVAPMNIDLKGNTLQTGTPTPSTPIPINNVSGDNDIVVCGKNLFDKDNPYLINGYVNYQTGVFSAQSSSNQKCLVIGVKPNTKYTWSGYSTTATVGYGLFTTIPNVNDTSNSYGRISDTKTITTGASDNYLVMFHSATNAGVDFTQFQVEQSEAITTYEAYNGTTYNIDLPVENLFDKDNANISNFYIYQNKIVSSPVDIMIILDIKPNTTYTIQKGLNTTLTNNRFKVGTCIDTPANNVSLTNYVGYGDGTQVQEITITSGTNDKYLVIHIANNQTNYNEIKGTIQIEYGSKKNSYTPYGTTPIELSKIGTYQDYFYKENDKWYLHKEIGKITFVGGTDEDWQYANQELGIFRLRSYLTGNSTDRTYVPYSNYYQGIAEQNAGAERINGKFYINSQNDFIDFLNTSITNATDFKTWLSTHNTIVYYVLQTPTNTEITYTPLIEQLDAILEAQSKKGTTNITQINNDLPFIITASVLSGSNSVVVNNKGNIYSKPIMTIYGKGTIGVYLSDTQIFSINLGDEEYITLDTANMEAYKVGVLKNRLVSGDYNSFKLETGNNTLTFTGIVDKVVIENYSRWI